MDIHQLLALPARPESEVEWEDLLLRLELMPRALKVEMENVAGDLPPGLVDELVRRESLVNERLERAATGSSSQEKSAFGSAVSTPSVPEGVDRFVRLRSRNFAMLQRRGINVWDWSVEIEPPTTATLFQILTLLARRDVELLGSLRNRRPPVRSEC